MSEALGFSAGNIRVVTVIAVWFSTLFFPFTLGTFSFLVMFILLVVSGLLGRVACDWVLTLVSRVFSGGF